MTNAETLILASASPRRAYLLHEVVGVRFNVLPADVDEAAEEDFPADPKGLVLHNARLKAETLASEYPACWILAADTTVSLERQIFNKPADLEEARRMLWQLSGRTHTVYTGVVLMNASQSVELTECIASRVTFKPLDDALIDRYFEKVNPLDKAGAYGIQQGGDLIISGHEGSWTNIMGLPVEWVKNALQEFSLLERLQTSTT